MKVPLVAIGVPCGDRVHTQFAMCLWGLGRGARGHRQGLALGQSSIVANSRNQLVDAMIAMQADYLMMIDTDMTFPLNTVDRLLAHDKDIVGATYVRRGPPFDNLGVTLSGESVQVDGGLVEMRRMPTGMLLIKAAVLAAMPRPVFRFTVDETAGMLNGEDFVFSDMARERGFRLWCDVNLSKEVGHLLQYSLTVEDPSVRASAERFKDEMKRVANG